MAYDDDRPPVSRRSLLLAAGGLMTAALSASCRTNSRDDEPDATTGPHATATPSPPVRPDPTASPSAPIVDAFDGSLLDVVATDDLNAYGHYEDARVSDDGVRHLIPLEAIDWGGVARDGIPALDNPDYVGPDRWSQMAYDPDGLVIGVEVDGKRRAYPLQILIWHEIVNETFDGKHLLVTY